VYYIWDEDSSKGVLVIFSSRYHQLPILTYCSTFPCFHYPLGHFPQISQLSYYSGSQHALLDRSFFRGLCYHNGMGFLPPPTWNILTQNNLGFSTRFRRPSLRRRVHLVRKRSIVLRCERHVDSSLRELSSGLRV